MQWKIEENHDGMTIRDYLQQEKDFSRRMLKVIKFQGGAIFVNGTSQDVRYCLQTGDVLFIQFPPEIASMYMVAQPVPLSIKYEDEAILVVDKPAGIATLPSSHHPGHTIANGVLAHYKSNNLPYTVHVVTRLDRDTSGLLLIAKHRYSHSLLDKILQNGHVTRKYKAFVQGHLKEKEGVIDAPIGRKEGSIIERQVIATGKQAITHFKVLQEFVDCSLISIHLETGRTHQIRVHFSDIGHPLIGDDLYGSVSSLLNRQALHCAEIHFIHPVTKAALMLESPLPKDMLGYVNNYTQK